MRRFFPGLVLAMLLVACPSSDALIREATDSGAELKDSGRIDATPTTDVDATAEVDAGASPADAGACAVYASPTGSDENAGTMQAPVRTLPRLLALAKADTLTCLLEGVYEGPLELKRPNLRIVGIGKAVVSRVIVETAASQTVLEDLGVAGSPVTDQPIILVLANQVVLRRLDVSGGSNATCVQLGTALQQVEGTQVERCRVHDCDRGIAVLSAKSAKITHSAIFNAVHAGVSLDPNAQSCEVSNCAIDKVTGPEEGDGIHLGGALTNPSSGNVIKSSVITNNKRWGMHAGWEGATTATGNSVEGNCFAGNGGTFETGAADGYVRIDNVTVTDPLYVDRVNGDYRLKPETPCGAGKGPSN